MEYSFLLSEHSVREYQIINTVQLMRNRTKHYCGKHEVISKKNLHNEI